MKYTYTIEYRLDDIEDYDSTEYIDDIPTKTGARKKAKEIIKEYGNRIVLLDIKKYDEDGYLDEVVECLIWYN